MKFNPNSGFNPCDVQDAYGQVLSGGLVVSGDTKTGMCVIQLRDVNGTTMYSWDGGETLKATVKLRPPLMLLGLTDKAKDSIAKAEAAEVAVLGPFRGVLQ